ncbi:molybdate ABC transporter substrate-binding protein [Caldibacillus thermolactis]|uniref:Molybdate ABC transporter substrate-binding protein n=1 Tax=Pallidibacillus thermolactis TaxID=251051 RepID=A0ABT2WJ83_9BACI|nr:molybdate ABC transporter substrate-binding protein [Pallidibacillus thermolactis]MCU9595761.1 molybdate ABC transporter substrate-binding protein [Pallidibacillus thermolactis]
MNKLFFCTFLFLATILSGCETTGEASSGNIHLTVSAAASMTGSLLEIKEKFQSEYPHVKIHYNLGGTGTLRKQIEQGAGIDLFFSASEKDYNLLKEKGLVEKGEVLFQNELVVIQPSKGKYQTFQEFIKGKGKLAIGTPEAVPAGTYAYQALNTMGVLEGLDNRIVFTKDVRQVLTFVQEKAVDMGIVYASDVVCEKDMKIVERIKPEHYEPINYYIAVIKGDHTIEKKEVMEKFYQFVMSEDGMSIFEDYGFMVN